MCLALTGCLPDLTKPPDIDGAPGGSDGGGELDAAVGPRCDPAEPFEEPVLLTTAPGSINTAEEEGWPRVSRDDRTLYFVRAASTDGGRFLGGAVQFVTRPDPDSLFDQESATEESEFTPGNNNDAPYLAPDETRLYYSNAGDNILFSDRGGTTGLFPYPGEEANFTTDGVRDMHPYLVGTDTLYFTSSRGGSPDELEAYRAVKNGDAFDAPESLNLTASMPVQQIAPVVSSDHRVVFFSADGTLYRAVRDGGSFDTAAPAEDLNEGISFAGSLSRDDCVLYLHSDRGGGDFDIWMARATVILDGN